MLMGREGGGEGEGGEGGREGRRKEEERKERGREGKERGREKRTRDGEGCRQKEMSQTSVKHPIPPRQSNLHQDLIAITNKQTNKQQKRHASTSRA